jgi:hypothetical protein
MWITVDVERALYVDRGRNVILCELMPGPQTLVLKLKGKEMRASSKCWICGEEEPHTHSQDEVERARVRDTYADIIEPFVKSNYVMDETSRWEAKRIADAIIAGGLARDTSEVDINNMRNVAATVRYRIALESIADWRNVNISGEYEHGLRDIIRSIIDRAVDALDAPQVPRPAPQAARTGRDAPVDSDWQPIETAPKDRLIMLCVEGYQPASGCWWPVDSCWTSFDWEGHFESDKEVSDYVNGTSYEPTHWMPLPAGPTSPLTSSEERRR